MNGTRRRPKSGITMAVISTTIGSNSSKRLQPDGMDWEAGLLAQLAEVPLVSKAWVQSPPRDGALITVSFPAIFSRRIVCALRVCRI